MFCVKTVVGNAAVVRLVAPPLTAEITKTTDFLVADNALLGKPGCILQRIAAKFVWIAKGKRLTEFIMS